MKIGLSLFTMDTNHLLIKRCRIFIAHIFCEPSFKKNYYEKI